jgi:trans-AT polyketide synthase, acyltransferase and oxidoreductase domains
MNNLKWKGSPKAIAFDEAGINTKLKNTQLSCYVVKDFMGRVGYTNEGEINSNGEGLDIVAMASPAGADQLGDASFRQDYNLQYCYKGGAMANGIASADLVIALGKAGCIGSFGAAGLIAPKIKAAIEKIQSELPTQSYAFNLIHSPSEKALEENAVALFLEHNIHIVEASAYMDVTLPIVYYRAKGLSQAQDGSNIIKNKVIAKISRREVAAKFMTPAPIKILDELLADGRITPLQHQLAQSIAVADDITVEADSGGHTDNRPLVALLPAIIDLRDELQLKYNYAKKIRVGAAGGIGTPAAALAAFMMGAAYIVTGSINQACIESGTSDYVKKLLAEVESTDVMMAPAADMFELGVHLQVLKRGTLFGSRAKKLYEIYNQNESIDTIPESERTQLEKQVFKMPLEDVWQSCISFFKERDPEQIERALNHPKRKMALIFRWYLGLSSNWANTGIADRVLDYQIWCGPSMGAFNTWTKGTPLALAENRKAADVAQLLMEETAILYRKQILKMQGVG